MTTKIKNGQVCLQKLYQMVAFAVNDRFPSGASGYQKLTIVQKGKEVALRDVLKKQITEEISSWPEWALATLDIPEGKGNFSRYSNAPKAKKPKKFSDLNPRFDQAKETLLDNLRSILKKSIARSLKKIESQENYSQAVQELQRYISLAKLEKTSEGMPLRDAMEFSRLTKDVIQAVFSTVKQDAQDFKNISYPYDTVRPCQWNVTMAMRVQVQIKKVLEDRLLKLAARCENQFLQVVRNDILQGEMMPHLRVLGSNTSFWKKVTKT